MGAIGRSSRPVRRVNARAISVSIRAKNMAAVQMNCMVILSAISS